MPVTRILRESRRVILNRALIPIELTHVRLDDAEKNHVMLNEVKYLNAISTHHSAEPLRWIRYAHHDNVYVA